MENTVIFKIREVERNRYAIITTNKRWAHHNRTSVSRLEIFPEMNAITRFFEEHTDLPVFFEVA